MNVHSIRKIETEINELCDKLDIAQNNKDSFAIQMHTRKIEQLLSKLPSNEVKVSTENNSIENILQ